MTDDRLRKAQVLLAGMSARHELGRLPDEVKADRWRNLYFDHEGRSYRGVNIWPSEREARTGAEEMLKTMRALAETIPAGDVWCETPDGPLFLSRYAHFIPVPWLAGWPS